MTFNCCNSIQGLEFAIQRMVFLSSGGASVNSGSKPGLFRLFQENYLWILFIYCFNHSLELAVKDALK